MDCGKKRYATKKDMRTQFNFLMNKKSHRRPDYLRGYFCSRCQGWHLTHKRDFNEPDED